MLVEVRPWLGLVLGAAGFLHEILNGQNPTVLTICVGMMGLPLAMRDRLW